MGLTYPIGNNLPEFRENLLAEKFGVSTTDLRYIGNLPAGICDYDATKYQKRKDVRRGTPAGSIAIYCAHEAMADSKLDLGTVGRSKMGVFIGITGHGNVERETEIANIKEFDSDTSMDQRGC
ncbi:hypothetical protein BVY04_03180 [bacterium M21]|nr:hypothetical protein BVY04_03180 [bacterium M21]